MLIDVNGSMFVSCLSTSFKTPSIHFSWLRSTLNLPCDVFLAKTFKNDLESNSRQLKTKTPQAVVLCVFGSLLPCVCVCGWCWLSMLIRKSLTGNQVGVIPRHTGLPSESLWSFTQAVHLISCSLPTKSGISDSVNQSVGLFVHLSITHPFNSLSLCVSLPLNLSLYLA